MIGNTQQFDADVGQFGDFCRGLQQEMKEQKRNEKRQKKLLEKGPQNGPGNIWQHQCQKLESRPCLDDVCHCVIASRRKEAEERKEEEERLCMTVKIQRCREVACLICCRQEGKEKERQEGQKGEKEEEKGEEAPRLHKVFALTILPLQIQEIYQRTPARSMLHHGGDMKPNSRRAKIQGRKRRSHLPHLRMPGGKPSK